MCGWSKNKYMLTCFSIYFRFHSHKYILIINTIWARTLCPARSLWLFIVVKISVPAVPVPRNSFDTFSPNFTLWLHPPHFQPDASVNKEQYWLWLFQCHTLKCNQIKIQHCFHIDAYWRHIYKLHTAQYMQLIIILTYCLVFMVEIQVTILDRNVSWIVQTD